MKALQSVPIVATPDKSRYISKADSSTEKHDENEQLNIDMLQKLHSEQKEKGSLQDVADAVSVETVVRQTWNHFH